MKQTTLLICFLFIFKNAIGQDINPLNNNISTFFNEVKDATKQNYALWNKDLYGPILLVDTKTRQIFANEADTTGVLKADGSFFSGILPNNINIANTSINFGGKRWAMIMLPLPKNEKERVNLLVHELFHSVQPTLGFALHNPENNHLDKMEGRIYLRLELEALKKAILSSSKKEIKQHLTHALAIRKYRHSIYAGSDSTENLLELNEGLAEFTGFIASERTKKQADEHFIKSIDNFLTNATFVRSFAYQTTPMYGYLLYNIDKNWNKQLSVKADLTSYFIKAFNINLPNKLETFVKNTSNNYNGEIIFQEETARDEKKNKLVAEYKLKFVEQPHFEIRFEKMNVSFDPRNITPIEDKGTVYPNIRVTDLWGVLTVENGALMSANWSKISITNPIKIEKKEIKGDGWVLELNEGYTVQKDIASSNYILVKKKD